MPEYTAPNVWPAEHVLPGFRSTCEDMCQLIIEVATLVARACDQFGNANIEGYKDGYLEKVVRTSNTTKARLLHYFPSDGALTSVFAEERDDAQCRDDERDDWCATHVDHGCLTGLTSAMYVDESVLQPGRSTHHGSNATPSDQPLPLPELPASPDLAAGLYIRSRSGETTQVRIPRDCLAFQTGEALELITKGRFKAVPHFVRGVKKDAGSMIARNTLAVFTQPNLDEIVDDERKLDFAAFSREVVGRHR